MSSERDEQRVVVEEAVFRLQQVLALVESGELTAGPDQVASLEAAVHSLRLIADVIDRGGNGVLFP